MVEGHMAHERFELRTGYEPSQTSKRTMGSLVLLGLILAYCLVVPLKLRGLLPPTVTWAGVILVPAIWFLTFSTFLLPVHTRRQQRTMLICVGIGIIAGFGAVYWQGWV